jgi:tetratricopeptide (TPR) repeat protein
MIGLFVVAAAIFAAAQAPPAAPAPVGQHADPLAVAEVMIGQQRHDDARQILDVLAAHPAHDRARDNQVQFLLGILDIEDKDYDSAIAHFHRILVNDPKQVRVRLELGRAYFMKHDYANAQRQFLFARAGHLPPDVQANVDRFLGAIRSLQTFSYGLSFSLAADSNLNAGPATDAVSLYGLPFQLSPNAQANSGVGLAFDTNAEWSPRVGKKLKWRLGTQLHRSQYRQTVFDDMTVGVYTGPHLTLKRWDFNVLGSVSRRWYGDRTYTNSVGGSFDATYYVTARLGLGAGAGLSHLAYPLNALQTGPGHTYSVNSFYTPTPASVVRAAASFGVQEAQSPAYANHSQQFGLTYSRDFHGGLTVSLAPSYTRIAYAAPLAAFATTRIDHQLSGQVALLDRKIDWSGFTPRLIYTVTRNASSIPLYAFHRSRVEFGFTRAF